MGTHEGILNTNRKTKSSDISSSHSKQQKNSKMCQYEAKTLHHYSHYIQEH